MQILEFQMAASHADGTFEMVGVDFQSPTAVADRIGVELEVIGGDGALIPSLCKPGCLFDKITGSSDRSLVFLLLIELNNRF